MIEAGRKWRIEKEAEGWQDTPDGLQPMSEIRKAGYAYKESTGEWVIPCEEYIADGNTDRPAGQKYWAASRQYIEWKNRRINNSYKTNDEEKEEQTNKLNFIEKKEVVKPIENNEIEIDKIPF